MTKQLFMDSYLTTHHIHVDGHYVGTVHELPDGKWLLDRREGPTETIKGSQYKAIVTLIGPQDAGELEDLLKGLRDHSDLQDA